MYRYIQILVKWYDSNGHYNMNVYITLRSTGLDGGGGGGGYRGEPTGIRTSLTSLAPFAVTKGQVLANIYIVSQSPGLSLQS
jgi:hypothetical protein